MAGLFPLLVRMTVQVPPPALAMQETEVALIWAEAVNDPKRPKTNPAMAMAAMSVIAMRITVGHSIYALVTVGHDNRD